MTFILKPRPPFRLDLTVWTLRRRPENEIDRWVGRTYRRVLLIGGMPALVEATQISSMDSPRLQVRVHCENVAVDMRKAATAAVERLLGIRQDLRAFYDFAAQKPQLEPLATRFRGMKPPRYLTGFECLTNAIACQQISLAAGIQLLNRFATAFGMPMDDSEGRQFAFPRPQDLVAADTSMLVGLGFSRQKAMALLELARLCEEGDFRLESLHRMSDDACVVRLSQLRGIGRWSAEYALLRGLGRLHVFPGDDVGARNNVKRWLGLSEDLDYDMVERILSRWRPFCGLVYFHLLLDKLTTAGHVELIPSS